jgi:hypothetical protein
MTEQKPTDLPVVALRPGTVDGFPGELILGDRNHAQVILLRPKQIKNLALDAVNMTLR